MYYGLSGVNLCLNLLLLIFYLRHCYSFLICIVWSIISLSSSIQQTGLCRRPGQWPGHFRNFCIYFVAGAHVVAGASKLTGALKNFLLVFRIPLFKQSKSTIKSKLQIISWFLSSFYVLDLINLMVSAGVSVGC